MNTSRSTALLTLCITLCSCVLLLGSARSPAETRDTCRPYWEEKDVQPRNNFVSHVKDGAWALSYKFMDYRGRWHSVECEVDDQKHKSLKESFGLFPCDEQRRPAGVPVCKSRTDKRFVVLTQSKETFLGYLKKRSLRIVDRALVPDYQALAEKGSGALYRCSQQLKERFQPGGMTVGNKEAARDWIAFFKAMRTTDNQELDPEFEAGGGKWIDGLLVQTEVLVGNHGDCDSKALAFLTLLADQQYQGVLFRSTKLDCDPTGEAGHAFAAVLRNERKEPMRVNLEKILLEARNINHTTFEQGSEQPHLKIGLLLSFDVFDFGGLRKGEPGVLEPWAYGEYIGLPIRTEAGSPERAAS